MPVRAWRGIVIERGLNVTYSDPVERSIQQADGTVGA
jgi:hypothetical protein